MIMQINDSFCWSYYTIKTWANGWILMTLKKKKNLSCVELAYVLKSGVFDPMSRRCKKTNSFFVFVIFLFLSVFAMSLVDLLLCLLLIAKNICNVFF